MVTIKNTQRSIKIDTQQLKLDAERVLKFLKYDKWELGIWLTTNTTIRRYNKQYRNKDKPTDILSFGYHHVAKAGDRIKIKNPEDANLGDLIMSIEYIEKTIRNLNCRLESRLQVLLVHGICHLLGYDHEKDDDYALMHKEEKRILHHLKKQ